MNVHYLDESTNPLWKDFEFSLKSKSVVIIPVPKNKDNRFRYSSRQEGADVSIIYFRFIGEDDCYVVPIKHIDSRSHYSSFNSFWVDFCRRTDTLVQTAYVFDSKLLYHLQDKYLMPHAVDVRDIQMLVWMVNGVQMDITQFYPKCMYVTERHSGYWDSCLAPITKLVQMCREIDMVFVSNFESYVKDALSQKALSKYQTMLMAYYMFERNGVSVDGVGKVNPRYHHQSLTGRPSCTNYGINFMALNKADGSRERIRPSKPNGLLVEMDYTAIHLYLIADIIGYDFGGENPHIHLSKTIFDVDAPSDEQYAQAKKLNFRYTYGTIPEEMLEIPFYNLLDGYRKSLWKQFATTGVVTSILFKKPFRLRVYTDLDETKLFNYLLQNYETEHNAKMLSQIVSVTSTADTKLILYTYDSFLFDYSPSDGVYIIGRIKSILEESGIPVSLSVGQNYHEMRKV